MKEFEGKRALVTGAGSGIGMAAALLLHERGARVMLVDLNPEAVTNLADQWGPNAFPHTANVADLSESQAMIARTVEQFGGLDILVNNAGIGGFGRVADVVRNNGGWSWRSIWTLSSSPAARQCRTWWKAAAPSSTPCRFRA